MIDFNEQEERILRDMANDLASSTAIARTLGRPRLQIVQKAKEMGVVLFVPPTKRLWLEGEIMALRELAPTGMGSEKIAQQIGRSRQAVIVKASSLRIKIKTDHSANRRKRPKTKDDSVETSSSHWAHNLVWTDEMDEELRELAASRIGLDAIAKRVGRSCSSVYTRARALGICILKPVKELRTKANPVPDLPYVPTPAERAELAHRKFCKKHGPFQDIGGAV